MTEWRYLPGGTVKHGFTELPGGFGTAFCGQSPVWYAPDEWRGTGSQDEYERVEQLPECKRCRAAMQRRGQA